VRLSAEGRCRLHNLSTRGGQLQAATIDRCSQTLGSTETIIWAARPEPDPVDPEPVQRPARMARVKGGTFGASTRFSPEHPGARVKGFDGARADQRHQVYRAWGPPRRAFPRGERAPHL